MLPPRPAEFHLPPAGRRRPQRHSWLLAMFVAPWVGLATVAHGQGSEADDAAALADGAPAITDWFVPGSAGGLCAGRFVESEAPVRDAGLPRARQPLHAEADRGRFRIGAGATLEGDVEFVRGDQSASAARADYDQQTGTVTLTGDVVLREPGVAVVAQSGSVDHQADTARVEQADFVLFDTGHHGTAATALRGADGGVEMTAATITRCPPGTLGWWLGASRLTVPPEGDSAWIRNATLRFKGVPLLWTPVGRVPLSNERQTGFLFPSIGYSNEEGVELAAPFYWNIAPNADLTLSPRVVSRRGAGLELEARHLNRQGSSQLGVSWLARDDLFDGSRSRRVHDALIASGGLAPGTPFEPESRWFYSARHDSRFSMDTLPGRFALFADYSDVSDTEYFRDLGTTLDIASEIRLPAIAGVDWSGGPWRARLWTQDYVSLVPGAVDSYARLPELQLDYARPLAAAWLGARPQLTVRSLVSAFDRDIDGLSGLNRITGERAHLRPELTLPFRWPFGELRLTAAAEHTRYALDDVPAGWSEQPDRTVAEVIADGTLVFEREFASGALMTLEPRLFYAFVSESDQAQLPLFDSSRLRFNYNALTRSRRFTGIDRIGDVHQVSTLLTSRWIDPDGVETIWAGVGQIHYLADRKVTLAGSPPGPAETRGSSAAAARAVWRPLRSVSITTDWIWDPRSTRTDLLGVLLRYNAGSRRLLSVDHRRIGTGIEQTEIGMHLPLGERWSFLAQVHQDWVADRPLEHFFGVEYDGCCFRVRVLAHRFLKAQTGATDLVAENGVFLQFVLKGLGDTGGRVDTILEQGIRGYRPYEDSYGN